MQAQKRYLSVFLFSIILLLIVGIIFVYSASSFIAQEKFANNFYYMQKQCLGIFLCMSVAIFFSLLEHSFIIKHITKLFFIALAACIATKIPGIGIGLNGAYRWLNLFFFSFQPVELLKPFAIIYFSYLLNKKKYSINSSYIGYLFIIGLIVLVLLLQPDFGQAVVIGITGMLLLFIAKFKLRTFAIISALSALGVSLLILLKPYRFKRLMIFLNPWKDPQGSGFQIIQSLIAIVNGGWTGLGIAHSKQKLFYLPMQHTDFIFSIICEETGILGGIIVIALYTTMMYCGISLALMQKEFTNMLIIFGITSIIFIQAVINICVATSMLPTKGIGLPFISYGISSLLGMGCMTGIVITFVLAEK